MKPSEIVRIILGPRPVIATICVFVLYCLYFLFILAASRGMAFYVVYSPTMAQVEAEARAGEWRDVDNKDVQENYRRARLLTVDTPKFTITVKQMEDPSTGERRLDFGDVLIEARPWGIVMQFAEEIIPFSIVCFALFGCWRVVRRWYDSRRRGIERQQGFEVL